MALQQLKVRSSVANKAVDDSLTQMAAILNDEKATREEKIEAVKTITALLAVTRPTGMWTDG